MGMEDPKLDAYYAELKEVKNPTKNLHTNGDKPLTTKEKAHIVLTSKTFTAAATLCTLGIYYLYYLFCLEQEQDSPFVKSDKGPEKYPCEKSEESDETYMEAKEINQQLTDIASGRPRKCYLALAQKEGKRLLDKTLFALSVNTSNLLSWIESGFIYVKNKGWKNKITRKVEDTKEKESYNLLEAVNQKIESLASKQDEKDITRALYTSLSKTNVKQPKDHYLTFVFYFTYLLLSLVTLGLFPLYHLGIKKRWSDFENIKNHKEYACKQEFNNLTGKLMGLDGSIEYSFLLMGERGLPLNLNFFSDAFRTKVFQTRSIRRNIVIFLMIITLGFFGVIVLAKNVFDDNKLNISEEDSRPTDYFAIEKKWDRFKMFLLDLIRDLRVAKKIAARRIATINNSISNVLDQRGRNDTPIIEFIKLLSSELYFWLFAFIFICSSITFIIVYTNWHPDFYSHFTFWCSILLSLTFLGLFTRHINLLFT